MGVSNVLKFKCEYIRPAVTTTPSCHIVLRRDLVATATGGQGTQAISDVIRISDCQTASRTTVHKSQENQASFPSRLKSQTLNPRASSTTFGRTSFNYGTFALSMSSIEIPNSAPFPSIAASATSSGCTSAGAQQSDSNVGVPCRGRLPNIEARRQEWVRAYR